MPQLALKLGTSSVRNDLGPDRGADAVEQLRDNHGVLRNLSLSSEEEKAIDRAVEEGNCSRTPRSVLLT